MSEVSTDETFFNGVVADIAEINPKTEISLAEEERVSFLPMQNTSESGNIISLQERAFREVSKGYTRFAENDILVAKITPCFENGKGGYAEGLLNGTSFGSTEFHIVRAIPGRADSRFLHHLTRSERFRRSGEGSMTGSAGQKRVPADFIKEFPIFIPPLPEQKKIAEILSGIDIAITKNKTKVQKLDALQFSLTEEFTQDLQESFEASALEEHAEIRTGVAKNSNNDGDMIEMPYMRVANVQDGYLDLSEVKAISIDRGRAERYLLRKGDVLINEGGDLDKVGRGVIWNEEVRQCLHQNHVFAVRCSEQLMPEFLSLCLKSSHSKNYFLGCAKQTTNLASINSTQLKSFPIPVPPLDEQKKFVEHIKSARDLSLAIATEMSALEAMKKAVSSDLLSGRKRVSV